MKKLTVDDGQRVRLPNAKPGQVFAYERSPDGAIRLVPVVAGEPRSVKAELVRRNGILVFEARGVKITAEAIAAAVGEDRESR